MDATGDIRSMTSETIGKDLLSALVTELKLLPDVWPKLPQAKQDDVIERLRKRVDNGVRMGVHLLSTQGRTTVAGQLAQITIKDGVKAVIEFASSAENLHNLYEYQGAEVLVVVADAQAHTGGMNEIKGESDQRAMDLGHEYHENDGGGMDGQIVEGTARALPSPETTE
jgi:hypothetical protein